MTTRYDLINDEELKKFDLLDPEYLDTVVKPLDMTDPGNINFGKPVKYRRSDIDPQPFMEV
jgi:hypothetical protein